MSKLERSHNYRSQYFENNKGIFGNLFFCPYCGKVMRDKSKIEIDHIHAVYKVRNRYWLKRTFSKEDDGVNTLSNLTHSCSR